jgi:spoIIIJ-associated protein
VSGPARKFFSADTETLAVMEAAAHFGLAPGRAGLPPVEKKHGFLRRPKAVIEVDPASPRRTEPAEAPAPVRQPAPPPSAAGREPARAESPAARPVGLSPRQDAPRSRPASVEAVDHPVELEPYAGPLAGLDGAVAAAVAVTALAGVRVAASGETVSAADDEQEWRVELSGPGRQALLARQGELLHSCEHLARRMVRELPPGGLVLDSGGFREERTRTLRRRAAAAAEEVRRSGEAVVFEPLPAAERRILHLAVEAEPGVASASEGEGERRSVRVFPRDEASARPT